MPEKVTMSLQSQQDTFPSLEVCRIMRAKADEGIMCAVSLIAIELKGLAAPGEALKNCKFQAPSSRLSDEFSDSKGCYLNLRRK